MRAGSKGGAGRRLLAAGAQAGRLLGVLMVEADAVGWLEGVVVGVLGGFWLKVLWRVRSLRRKGGLGRWLWCAAKAASVRLAAAA